MSLSQLIALFAHNAPIVKFKNGQAWLFVCNGAYVRIFDDIFDATIYSLAHYGICPKLAD